MAKLAQRLRAPIQQEPTGPLTSFPGKQGSLLTWPRPPARQKFLFSTTQGYSCQLGHQSIRLPSSSRFQGQGALPRPCHTPRLQVASSSRSGIQDGIPWALGCDPQLSPLVPCAGHIPRPTVHHLLSAPALWTAHRPWVPAAPQSLSFLLLKAGSVRSSPGGLHAK